MGTKSYIPRYGINRTKALLLEKKLLENHYSFLSVKIAEGTLFCTGSYQPSERSVNYEYLMKFTPGDHPKVYVVNPVITYDEEIHMYSSDSRLCLYYPKDYSFTATSHLYNTIIPWTHEWFVFYELYLLTGKWLHPHVEHNKI